MMKNNSLNLFIVGAQKCASSSLRAYLNQHPDIFLLPKEAHLFTKKNWQERLPDYFKMFEGRKEKYLGEKTPAYFHVPQIPNRIAQVNPDAKFIVILRNPTDRAYSAYRFWRSHGKFPLVINTFDDVMFSLKQDWADIRNIGKYIIHLRNYVHTFPKENILVLTLEDLKSKPQKTLEKVCDFLEIPRIKFHTEDKRNTTVTPNSRLILAFLIFRWCVKILRKIVTRNNKEGLVVHGLNSMRTKVRDTRCSRGYVSMHPETRKKLDEFYKPYNDELKEEWGISW